MAHGPEAQRAASLGSVSGEDIFTYKCLQQIGVQAADLSQARDGLARLAAQGVIDSYCAKTTGCVGHQGEMPRTHLTRSFNEKAQAFTYHVIHPK